MQFLAWNGETRRLLLIPNASSEDKAREEAAGENSDGDELTIISIEEKSVKAGAVDITDALGID
jgi:hypothetical protein